MLILSSFKRLILHLHFTRFPLKITSVNQLLRLHLHYNYILNSTTHLLCYSNRLYPLKHDKYLEN